MNTAMSETSVRYAYVSPERCKTNRYCIENGSSRLQRRVTARKVAAAR